jgi:hypothetical protein
MTVTALLEIALHLLFGTPYLTTRTALLYVPLYGLFFTFVVQALARSTAATAIARTIMIVVVLLAAGHFVRVANLTRVHEWTDDASTKAMMEDVRELARALPPQSHVAGGAHLVIGVERAYGPAAVYYARRTHDARIGVAAPSLAVDLFYGAAHHVPAGRPVLHIYPLTGTALAWR